MTTRRSTSRMSMLIERGSLGTRAARRARRSVSAAEGARVVRAVSERTTAGNVVTLKPKSS